MDVCAPGVDVLSLRANGTDLYGNEIHIVDDKYYRSNGTSMSCPHVAGLAALMLANNPNLTFDMIITLLRNTNDPALSPVPFGRGRINASRVMQRAPAIALLDDVSEWTNVTQTLSITGSAWGELFQYYCIEYGSGIEPTSWIEIENNTIPIIDDVLTQIDTTFLPEGLYTIKLRVKCQDGVYSESVQIVVNNFFDIFIVDDDSHCVRS